MVLGILEIFELAIFSEKKMATNICFSDFKHVSTAKSSNGKLAVVLKSSSVFCEHSLISAKNPIFFNRAEINFRIANTHPFHASLNVIAHSYVSLAIA